MTHADECICDADATVRMLSQLTDDEALLIVEDDPFQRDAIKFIIESIVEVVNMEARSRVSETEPGWWSPNVADRIHGLRLHIQSCDAQDAWAALRTGEFDVALIDE